MLYYTIKKQQVKSGRAKLLFILSKCFYKKLCKCERLPAACTYCL
jgi:hypothetical protein